MASRPNVGAPPRFDQVVDPRKNAIFFDDFVFGDTAGDDTATGSGIGELGWIVTDVAGAADSDVVVHTTAADIKGHPGVIDLGSGPTTPTAADEGSLFCQNLDAVVLYDTSDGNDESNESIYAAFLVNLPSVADVELTVGLFDAANAAGRGANSVFIELDASADAEFVCGVVDGSSATATATTVTAAASTWYLLEIFAHEDECQFWIGTAGADPVHVATVTGANIPDDEPLTPGIKIATETTAEKHVLVDYFYMRVPVNR